MPYVRFNSLINYVSEHQLSHVANASHTTPTILVNCGPMLLKLIGGDIVYILSGSLTYPGPRPVFLALNQVVSSGIQYMNSNNINMRDVSHPRKPCNGTLFRLRNLYPRSTQDTDIVFPINFFNHGTSCLITLFYRLLRSNNIHVVTPRSRGYGDVTATYIRRSEIPIRIYAKHQYRQESEYGSTVVTNNPAIITPVHSYHKA